MNIVQSGIVLKVENYLECRKFYRERLDLSVLFEKKHATWSITCFEIGCGYLLLETGGTGSPPAKSYAESPVKIRLNVVDLDSAVIEIVDRGINTKIQRQEWGDVAEFCDPDGNRIALMEHIAN